jgi:hypothetical protein
MAGDSEGNPAKKDKPQGDPGSDASVIPPEAVF